MAHAARTIGRSHIRRVVFDAVCSGKARAKSVEEIAASRRITRKQVLTAGKILADNHIVTQTKKAGDTAYEKDRFYCSHKTRILSLAGNAAKLAKLPTKTNARAAAPSTVLARLPKRQVNVRRVTVDDIASFVKVRGVSPKGLRPVKIAEKDFKEGVQRILGEQGKFKDWGGEKNDLWTTRLAVGKTRVRAAVAFKGPGQKGRLTPAKLGKNGDQIQRLFASAADLFLVQYWDRVDESVYEQMEAFATARSVRQGGSAVTYGVIDGTDSARLIAAYSREFKKGAP